MAITHKTWFEEPGEPLFVPPHLLDHGLKAIRFSQASGLGPEQVSLSSLVSTPVPKFGAHAGPKGLPGLKPEFLAHPLVWLPQRLSGRYVISRDSEGNPTSVETYDHYLVRVVVEMLMAGLYDEPKGMWVDCFALMGLDGKDPATIERAQRWLDGEDDTVFDLFNLDHYLHAEETASDVHADSMMESLYVECWALQSESLSQLAADVATGLTGDLDPRAIGSEVAMHADMAMPSTPLVDYARWKHWDDFVRELEDCEADRIPVIMEEFGAQLLAVRNHFVARRDEMRAEMGIALEDEGVTQEMLSGEDTETPWDGSVPDALAPEGETSAAASRYLAIAAAPEQVEDEVVITDLTLKGADDELEDPFEDDEDELEDPFVAESEAVVEGDELEDPFEDELKRDSFVW